jgi:hypothetical protein
MSESWKRYLSRVFRQARKRRGAGGLPRRARPTLEVLERRELLAVIPVTTDMDNGRDANPTPGSLRAAILAARANDAITFNIPGAGVHTIAPPAPLPPVAQKVTIDGYSQPGATANTLAEGDGAVLLIRLDGRNAGRGANGLTINAAGGTVEGLMITRFKGNGIELKKGGEHGRGRLHRHQ